MSLNFAGVNFWHFKLKLLDRPNIIHSLEYLRFMPLGGKDRGIRKLEFVTKTQFLFRLLRNELLGLNFA